MFAMSSLRLLAATALVFAVGASGASALAPGSGLHGTVTRGPISPVCRAGVPCTAPAAKVELTFTRAGVVRATRTDAHGAYRLALAAGIYTVATSSAGFPSGPRPARVHVRTGHFDRIDFTIDTGIR
jgi:Carboxypeptidase regulatory-like domain